MPNVIASEAIDPLLLVISALPPLGLLLYAILLFLTPPLPPTLPSERSFLSPASPKDHLDLPRPLSSSTPNEPASLALSIIVPAYNEKTRLPPMLNELYDWISSKERTRKDVYGANVGETVGWEVIVVDDGSKDGTALTALEVGRKWESNGWTEMEKRGLGKGAMRVVTLENNRGKGGAVKHGILHSRGARVLFADADGASTFSSLALLQKDLDMIEISSPSSDSTIPTDDSSASTSAFKPKGDGIKKRGGENGRVSNASAKTEDSKWGIAIGSRAHLVGTDLVVKRSFLRNCLMHGFHLFVRTLGVRNIRDTQCGFKLFTRETAAVLFERMHLERWSFDVELLVLADACRVKEGAKDRPFPIPIKETAIQWQEVPGSKINLAWDSLCMARDLIVLRLCLGIGRWEIPVLSAGSKG